MLVGAQQATGNRTISLTANKGKYLVVFTLSGGYALASPPVTSHEVVDTGDLDISCSNSNCNIETVSGYFVRDKASSVVATNLYAGNYCTSRLYYLDVNNDNTTITVSNSSFGSSASSVGSQVISMQLIPIS